MEQRTSPPQGQELANLEEDPINLPLSEERYEPLFVAMDELGAGVWRCVCPRSTWVARAVPPPMCWGSGRLGYISANRLASDGPRWGPGPGSIR